VSHASMVAMNHLLLLLIPNHLRPICCSELFMLWCQVYLICVHVNLDVDKFRAFNLCTC
jgi:hypothetical protein